jgi:trigger factor
MEPQQFIEAMGQSNQLPAMAGEVARSKALAVALRRIEVKDTAGAVIDLSDFIGSDEDDAAADMLQEAVAEATAAAEAEEAAEEAVEIAEEAVEIAEADEETAE